MKGKKEVEGTSGTKRSSKSRGLLTFFVVLAMALAIAAFQVRCLLGYITFSKIS